jgi:Tol biopolymer transport system component
MRATRAAHHLKVMQAGIILVLLAGCGSAPTPAGTVVAESHTPLTTPTARPTSTRHPSRTPPPTISASEKSRRATQEALPKGCITYPDKPSTFSPDGIWMLAWCGEDLLIIRNDGNQTRELKGEDYFYRPQEDHGDNYLVVDHWSQDGIYLFFYSTQGSSGGPCLFATSASGYGLFRLNVQTGMVTSILPVVKTNYHFYEFSFSPSNRHLVYNDIPGSRTIIDLISEKQFSIETTESVNEVGGYLWSRDDTHFVFVTEKEKDDDTIFSLWLVDISTKSQTRLLQETNRCIAPISWSQDDTFTYKLVDWPESWSESIVTMKPLTGIASVTTTPEP